MSSNRKAFTLIETLVSLIIVSIILIGLFNTFGATEAGSDAILDQGSADANASSQVDSLADHIRNAATCENAANGMVGSALDAGNATGFTYYIDSNCTKVFYFLLGTKLERKDPNGTTVEMTNVQSVTCTYYTMGSYYGTLIPTANPNQPTPAEAPKVSAVKITVSVAENGYVGTYETIVRLRNSPMKQYLSG